MSRSKSLLLIVFFVSLATAGCGGDRSMGVLLPTTGSASDYGISVRNGVRMALAEAETRAGLPAGSEVFQVDTASRPRVAADELHRLVRDHDIAIVVGGVTTAEAEALIPVIEENHILCVSPSAPANLLASRSRYFFRLFATDEVEGSTVARHLYNSRAVRRVLVVTDDSVFTRGIETEFRQHFKLNMGGDIVATIHTGVEHWKTQLADKLHAHEPQAVYVVGHGENTLQVLQVLREIDFEGIRATTSSLYLSHVVAGGGEAAEGVVFPLVAFDAAAKEGQVADFAERYRDQYGYSPDIYAAHGYDAMRVAIRTLSQADAQHPKVLRQYMTIGLRDFTGVTGAVAFDERGDVPRYPVMHEIWQQRVVRSSWLQEMRLRAMEEVTKRLKPDPTPHA